MIENVEFKRPTLEDKELFRSYLQKYPSRSCDRTFANIYLWAKHYHVEYALVNEVLLFRVKGEDACSFAYPVGEASKIKELFDYLLENCDGEFTLYSVTETQFAQLEEWYPEEFTIEFDEDLADYVYEAEKLKSLSGKKLHSKRNHINKFKAEHAQWSYEPITEDNYEECFQMSLKWREENEMEEDEEKRYELAVTQNALRLMKELDLLGGVLRVEDNIVAFTIGEAISEDTFVVHIEKAFAEIQGAYPMINQQFVLHEGGKYQYINREEDMGVPGLRRAKQSYRPVFMVEKGRVRRKRN
jgi:Uncharacterized conserved protein